MVTCIIKFLLSSFHLLIMSDCTHPLVLSLYGDYRWFLKSKLCTSYNSILQLLSFSSLLLTAAINFKGISLLPFPLMIPYYIYFSYINSTFDYWVYSLKHSVLLYAKRFWLLIMNVSLILYFLFALIFFLNRLCSKLCLMLFYIYSDLYCPFAFYPHIKAEES